MQREIDKQIQEARPMLRDIAPLTAAICWGYAIINMALGLGMFFIYTGAVAPIAIANILSYQQWGMVYFSIGMLTAYGLLKNFWVMTRNTQILGLVVKAIWAIALIVRCIDFPQTIIITLVWLFFAYIQAATYVFFIPRVRNEHNR